MTSGVAYSGSRASSKDDPGQNPSGPCVVGITAALPGSCVIGRDSLIREDPRKCRIRKSGGHDHWWRSDLGCSDCRGNVDVIGVPWPRTKPGVVWLIHPSGGRADKRIALVEITSFADNRTSPSICIAQDDRTQLRSKRRADPCIVVGTAVAERLGFRTQLFFCIRL